jgi:glycyl-tRNA synthetase alpha subunit
MSKATEIWNKGIGSVHGSDVTQRLCYETASNLAAYASELEKEQSDLDWLEGEVKTEYDLLLKHSEYNKSEYANGVRAGFRAVRTFIKSRKEAKP